MSLASIGKSYEGNPIYVVKISSGPGINKPAILMDAGIHAREWIAPSTALYAIHQLVTNKTNSHLYQDVDWYIIPNLNPDGYEFTHTKVRIQNHHMIIFFKLSELFIFKFKLNIQVIINNSIYYE